MNGYILISRSILASDIWKKPPIYQKVWLYLLLNAQYKPYKQLDRGQLFTSIPEIQEACSYFVGYRKEVPSRDQIYKVLSWLRSARESNNESGTKATMITTTKATHGLLVTICNFNVYQCSENYESNDESSDERFTKAERKKLTTNNINEERTNKEKKGENIHSADARQIIDYLNTRIGSSYKATTASTNKYIKARINDGFTVDDFKTVIDKKYDEWHGTDMQKFLRPETLFGNKFESYLNAKAVYQRNPEREIRRKFAE